jgi:hypothetical protein
MPAIRMLARRDRCRTPPAVSESPSGMSFFFPMLLPTIGHDRFLIDGTVIDDSQLALRDRHAFGLEQLACAVLGLEYPLRAEAQPRLLQRLPHPRLLQHSSCAVTLQ